MKRMGRSKYGLITQAEKIPMNVTVYLTAKRMEKENRKEQRTKSLYLPVVCGFVGMTIPLMWIVGMR